MKFSGQLSCNISYSDPHLCSRKLVRKFIRFLWNPLPLLQTPQNLIRMTGKKKRSSILLWVSFVIFQPIGHTTHPLKGENPAASSNAQQNVEGPSVASSHHMSCALADLVKYWKTTQCFHHLANDVLLPMKGGGHITKQPMKKIINRMIFLIG